MARGKKASESADSTEEVTQEVNENPEQETVESTGEESQEGLKAYKTVRGETVNIPPQPKGPVYDKTTNLHLVNYNGNWDRVKGSFVGSVLAADPSFNLVLPEGSEFQKEKWASPAKK